MSRENLVTVQHPMNENEISNEMLAFQANFVLIHGAGKTQRVYDRPHSECTAFRMKGCIPNERVHSE